jgi:hypothetical protein
VGRRGERKKQRERRRTAGITKGGRFFHCDQSAWGLKEIRASPALLAIPRVIHAKLAAARTTKTRDKKSPKPDELVSGFLGRCRPGRLCPGRLKWCYRCTPHMACQYVASSNRRANNWEQVYRRRCAALSSCPRSLPARRHGGPAWRQARCRMKHGDSPVLFAVHARGACMHR